MQKTLQSLLQPLCNDEIGFKFFREDGKIKLLTKGDNNEVDDRGLYKPGQLWVEQDHIVGRARGFVPYVGMVTILMNDYPKLKVRFPDVWYFSVIPAQVLLRDPYAYKTTESTLN